MKFQCPTFLLNAETAFLSFQSQWISMVALKGQMHCDIRKHQQMENVAKTHKNQVKLHKTQQKEK